MHSKGHIEDSVNEKCHLEDPVDEKCHVEDPVDEKCHVEDPVDEKCHIENPVDEKWHVEDPVDEKSHEEDAVNEKFNVEDPVDEKCHVEDLVDEKHWHTLDHAWKHLMTYFTVLKIKTVMEARGIQIVFFKSANSFHSPKSLEIPTVLRLRDFLYFMYTIWQDVGESKMWHRNSVCNLFSYRIHPIHTQYTLC